MLISTVKNVSRRHGLRGCHPIRRLQKPEGSRPSGGKFCGQMKQTLSSLTTILSNMLEGEKVRPKNTMTTGKHSGGSISTSETDALQSKCDHEEAGLPSFR